MLERRDLPLSALRAFEAAGRQLHMGRAGADLGVTHGAISHQVRALEDQLGVKLFSRAHNRLLLTSAGERLLQAVQAGFDRILDGTLHLDPESLAGDLVIGCTQTIAQSWAVLQISQFHATYPQIHIRVVELEPRQRDIPGEVDVAICYGPPDAASRRVEELVAPPLFPVCSPRLFSDRSAINRPEHLTRYPLLHDGQNSWATWFRAMDVPFPNDTDQIHFFNNVLCIKAARQGFGIALSNLMEVQDDLRDGLLVKLMGRTIPEAQSYYLLTDGPEVQSLRARLFEASIRERAIPVDLRS